MITTHITINLTSQVSPQLIQAVQGDTGRSICFKLADFTIPAGAAATYYIQKPSGEAIYNSATISGNEITCELTAQSLAEIGENPMQVRISADGEIVTSFDAILLVRPFRGIDAIESSTEMNIFDQAVEKAAEDFQEQAEQIVEEVIESIPADYTELTEEVDELNERIDNIEPGLSDDAKAALLACFRHVAFLDDDADYYGALENALYADDYPRISAVFNPGLNVIYTDDSLDSLKQYLTVQYYETAESAGITLDSTDYSLSGILVKGTSTVFVSYESLITSFTINGVVDFYDIWDWSLTNGYIVKRTTSSLDLNSNVPSGISLRNDAYTVNRRAYVTTRGKMPIDDYSTAQPTIYYPVPIPERANKVTVSIAPSSQYIYVTVVHFDPSTGKYSHLSHSGWQQGNSVMSLTAQENSFIYFNSKYDSSGSSYPTEPTNVSITFEEV